MREVTVNRQLGEHSCTQILTIGGRYRNSEGNSEIATYAYCPYADLESEGKIGYAFNNVVRSVLLYLRFRTNAWTKIKL